MANVTTAEQLAQRAMDVQVLDERQLHSAWSDLGTRNVSLGDFSQLLVRKGLLTSYQLDRLTKGLKTGFFYDDYKVLYCVGSGTFARVFRAVHRETGKVYAVKVLRSRHSSNPKEAELFRREGELGKSLVHKNIVPIHDVISAAGTHYLVMDFIEGRNLREFYKIRKKFKPEEATQIISGMVAGLNHAFQQGVTHRDLKMSNVLISAAGEAMLVDFGLAGFDPDDVEGDGANPRTIDYAGLERATNVRKDDTRSDIFFAGCIFYQMVSGHPPLAETRDRMQRLSKTRYQDITPLLELAPDLPLPLAMVINKAIEFDPERRYQTPGDMLSDTKIALRRIKAGAEGETGGDKRLESHEGVGDDGQQRKILVVESLTKRQDVLRDLFKRNGYRVLVTADPERAMNRFLDDPTAADLVLFCSGSIGKPAVEAFNRFGQEASTREVPALLLLDEAQADWRMLAELNGHRQVLAMPVKLKELRGAARTVLGVGTA